MRAAGSAQSQSVQLQDPLEVRKEHLDFLSIFARLLVKAGLGDSTSDIACGLINAALDSSYRRVGAAAGLHRTTRAIGVPGLVEKRIGFGNAGARVLECAPVSA